MPKTTIITPDASSTVKGKVQLAGNLGGTAASPTVVGVQQNAVGGPGLATNAIKLGVTTLTASVGPTSTSTSDVDVTGLTVTVTVPAGGRDIRILARGPDYQQTGGIGTHYGVIKIKESTTVLDSTNVTPGTANLPYGWQVETVVSAPSAASHTYKVAVAQNSTGPNYTMGASSTAKMMILVELI